MADRRVPVSERLPDRSPPLPVLPSPSRPRPLLPHRRPSPGDVARVGERARLLREHATESRRAARDLVETSWLLRCEIAEARLLRDERAFRTASHRPAAPLADEV